MQVWALRARACILCKPCPKTPTPKWALRVHEPEALAGVGLFVYLLGPARDATTYCRPWVWCAPDRMYCSEPRAARDVASVPSLAALASLMG